MTDWWSDPSSTPTVPSPGIDKTRVVTGSPPVAPGLPRPPTAAPLDPSDQAGQIEGAAPAPTARGPWPSASDFVAALQDPQGTLLDPDLASARVAEGLFGLPAVAMGQSAAVFRLEGRRAWALRCLTMAGPGLADRYQRLNDRLTQSPLPYFVETRWLEEGIRVSGATWPIVKMEWVDGQTLDQWIAAHLDDPQGLLDLEQRFIRSLNEIWTAGIVHGDLQHGNMIVREDGQLILVDYDGTSVFDVSRPEAFASQPSGESGHPNYQHPHHVETGLPSPWDDTFPGLVITTSIAALARRPELWSAYHNEENLIFSAADLEDPGGTELWRDLRAIPDLSERLENLERLCGRDSNITSTYATIEVSGVALCGKTWRKKTASAIRDVGAGGDDWAGSQDTSGERREQTFWDTPSGDSNIRAIAIAIAIAVLIMVILGAVANSSGSQ